MGVRPDPTLMDYVAVARRHKWLVLLATVLAAAIAGLVATRQVAEYQASADVLLNPDASLVIGAGRSAADAQARFDAGQAQVAKTPEVAAGALPRGGHTLTANALASAVSVQSDPTSNVLTFSMTSRSPARAVFLVNRYVDAYQRYSAAQATKRIRAAVRSESAQVESLQTKIQTAKSAGQPTAGLRATLHNIVNDRARDKNSLTSVSASGGAQVIRRATGAHQTQPEVVRDAILGGLFGLIVGILAAFARNAADTRVRSADEYAAALGLTLLARIPAPPRKLASKDALATLEEGSDPHSEAYRKLRVAMDFANLDLRAKSIVVSSAVEQEGKSTTVANLAVVLALAGRRVILVDLDLRRPYVHRFFGGRAAPGVTDIALGRSTLDEAMIPVTVGPLVASADSNGNGSGSSMVWVLPCGTLPPNPSEFLESEALGQLLEAVKSRADVVLLDSAPLMPVADGSVLARQADGLLVIVNAQLVKRPMLREFRRLLDSCPHKLGFVLTGTEADSTYGYGYDYVPAAGQPTATRPAPVAGQHRGSA